MKSCIVFIVAIGAATCLGTGPYLPSGWRPKGPAFILPTEVTAEEKLQESAESEASGSDALREYGLPASQDIYQAITVQALPDLYTERAFAAENEVVENETLSVSDKVTIELRSNGFESESVGSGIEGFNPTEATTTGVTVQDLVVTQIVIGDEVKEPRSENSPSDNETNDSATEILIETTEQSEDIVQTTEENVLNEEDSLTLITSNELRIEVFDNNNVSNKNDLEETLNGDSGTSKAAEGFREYGPPEPQTDEEKATIDAKGNRQRRFSSKHTIGKKSSF